jgi:uncharacterized protein YgiM (DUF1202 family)
MMQTAHATCLLSLSVAGCRAAAGLLLLALAHGAYAQTPGQTPSERVRVPTSHANVHMGPSSGQEVLVLVPRGTVLVVLGRDKEWIQVQLTPELRKTGMVMRWYKNEDRGWMHDSTVEAVKPEAK